MTTLLSKAEEAASTPEVSEDSLVDLDTKVSQQGSAVKAAKEVRSPPILHAQSEPDVMETVKEVEQEHLTKEEAEMSQQRLLVFLQRCLQPY